MDELGQRVETLEKDVIEIKACVDVNLTGERSVWAALEKLTDSIGEFEKASEKDRKGIHELVNLQAIEAVKLTTAYSGMASILKALGITIIGAVVGILVGLLTHTIQIGG